MKKTLTEEQLKTLRGGGYQGTGTMVSLIENLQYDFWEIENVSKSSWEVRAERKFRSEELIDALFLFAKDKHRV